VINIASVNGQKSAFGPNSYSAAKAGKLGFNKAVAVEVGRKPVTINTISPDCMGTRRDGDFRESSENRPARSTRVHR
jgi:NAD(P)-dependent dehydrogenase (short-subunit alcohol dehydrogenase family)